MKELRQNMRVVGMFVVIAFICLSAWFALTVFEQGSIWASNSHNTRLNASRSQRGLITDRNGTVLASTEAGQRVYSKDENVRRALAATLGDTAGMSGTGVEGFYSSSLLDISSSLPDRIRALFFGEARTGNSIQLTINAPLTAHIASRFPQGYRGAAVVTNYQTGEILAMVSKPDYDPYEAGTDTVEDTAYLNRCLQGLYTPGSVFKIVTLAAALEHDPNVLHQSFICSGSWHYENGSIVCAGQTAHGTIDLQTALEKSCNVTFGKLAYQLGLDRLLDTARRLGFNENFKFGEFTMYNSQFPESQANMSDLVWAGIGQGTVQVTPLHMAMITGAVANDGLMMKPRLVQSITASTGIVKQIGSSEPFRQVMSSATAQVIGEYMLGAVRSGTAQRAAIDGLRVCGKTGSAEISNDKTVETHAWYTGYIDDPAHPYAITVIIEKGGSGARMPSELAADALRTAVQLVG